ncbi:hypothetical protein ACNKHK_02375 [Shigella flexneri]
MDPRKRQLQDDLRVHQYLLGYASDLNFLPVALQPYGIGFLEKGLRSPPLTTPCGSIVRSISMSECCITSRVPRPPVPGVLYAGVLYAGRRAGRLYRAGRGNA